MLQYIPRHPFSSQALVRGKLVPLRWVHVSVRLICFSLATRPVNPPLVAGLLAIFFGLVTPLRRTFFEEGGALNASVVQSLISLGKLYTALQIFVLGGKLVAKGWVGRHKETPDPCTISVVHCAGCL